jgi:hypothetical protein
VKKVIFHEKSEIKSEKSEISEKSEFVEALGMWHAYNVSLESALTNW